MNKQISANMAKMFQVKKRGKETKKKKKKSPLFLANTTNVRMPEV